MLTPPHRAAASNGPAGPPSTAATEKSSPLHLSPRPSLPIVARPSIDVDEDTRESIRRLARRLRSEEPALTATEPFGSVVKQGFGLGPTVLLEDHSVIALADKYGDSCLEYRSLFLAADGDIMIVGGNRDRAFERYALDLLGLSDVEILCPDWSGSGQPLSLAERCIYDPSVFSTLVEAARRADGITLLPYMGSGHVWALGCAIAKEAQRTVHIASAAPRLVRRVNDKLWFAQRVTELLGHRALPKTLSAYGPAALSGQVHALLRGSDRVVVKLPDSSGAEGNLVVDAASLRDLPIDQLHDRLVDLLHSLGWRDGYPLAVGVWDSPVCDSPSAQIWIPKLEEGPPAVQAIFSQVVTGERGEFIGAMASSLPEDWQLRLAREALLLSTLFQELGYFGQCSFDAIIAGPDLDRAQLHWLECNGRWGGVSIPLVMANRLNGSWQERPLVIVQNTRRTTRRFETFSSVLSVLDDVLYDADTDRAGVVPLTPSCYVEGTGVHFVAFGQSTEDSKAISERASYLLSEQV